MQSLNLLCASLYPGSSTAPNMCRTVLQAAFCQLGKLEVDHSCAKGVFNTVCGAAGLAGQQTHRLTFEQIFLRQQDQIGHEPQRLTKPYVRHINA